MALLISGYYELAYNYLTLEKWRFIGRLAWFSTVTHLAVASCLMGFLYRHFYICLLRVFFMVCLVILLLGATVPFYKVGGVESDVPAIYLYLIHSNPSTLEVEPIFAGILICLSLFVRLYKLFESPSQLLSYFLDKYISRIPGWLIHGIACLQTRSTRWNVLLHMLVLQPFVACLILTKTYLFLLSSKAFEVLKTEATSQVGL